MLIGLPKEIKNHEYRVSASPPPACANSRARMGIRYWRRHGAGAAIGLTDEQYRDCWRPDSRPTSVRSLRAKLK
jgi:alanine dehydrogenase